MKVLLLGHDGWIGQKIQPLLTAKRIEYIVTGLRGEDVKLQKIITENLVTHVYCCLGRTHGTIDDTLYTTIDYLEHKETLHQNINDDLYVPLSLSLFCDKQIIHFTYIGTGCIFNDERPSNNEENLPNFSGSNYSIVKGFTDMRMAQTNSLILRIRMPVSSDRNARNFISKITTYDKICSTPNSMTVLDELLPLSLEKMKNCTVGCYNFTNPGVITHNQILKMYKEIVDPDFVWTNMTLQVQDTILLSKRSTNKLNTDKLEAYYHLNSIHTAVRNSLKIMAAHDSELRAADGIQNIIV